MKSSSIADSVFNVNLAYSRKQNKTKELFFRCLEEGRDLEYFEAEIRKIWDTDDTRYLEEQVAEYRAYIHEENTNKKMTKQEKDKINVVGIVGVAGAILLANKLFEKSKTKEYKIRSESYGYKTNKDEYLEKLVPNTYLTLFFSKLLQNTSYYLSYFIFFKLLQKASYTYLTLFFSNSYRKLVITYLLYFFKSNRNFTALFYFKKS